MRIGIIGAGSLGTALGHRLAQRGHEIMYGGGASAHHTAAQQGAAAGSNAEAAACGEVIAPAIADAGALEDPVLWSCVNALRPDLSGLAVGFDTSAAEQVARLADGARVVAAIPPLATAIAAGNVSYEGGLSPSVFVCGDDEHAKRLVDRLLADLGAQPVDAGPLQAARLVEPAMMLLVSIAYGGVPRDVALRLLERVSRPNSAAPESVQTRRHRDG